MKAEEKIARVYKVARLYYEEGLKKNQISELIGITAPHVANLLKEARNRGIVKITIELPRLYVLQEKLKKRFGLREVIVIPYERDISVLLKQLGQAAAEYFDDTVKDGGSVALGGGYLMYEMIAKLPQQKRDVHIYPAAIIGRGPTITHIDPTALVTLLWVKSHRLPEHAHYVTVTPLDQEGTTRDLQRHYKALLKKASVQELFKKLLTVDCLFASIGALNPNPDYVSATQFATRNLIHELKFDAAEIDNLRKNGVVGDIVYSFFDQQGNAVRRYDLAASIGIDALRTMAADPSKHVVVVVGSYKIEALRAVLQGRLCNVLVTDMRAAELLLLEDQEV
jgi:DNA-binding transcriptional regulator LsrR (DeoR family)